jgi:hypothetical protein
MSWVWFYVRALVPRDMFRTLSTPGNAVRPWNLNENDWKEWFPTYGYANEAHGKLYWRAAMMNE